MSNFDAVEVCFFRQVDLNGPVSVARPDLGRCWLWNGPVDNGYGRFRSLRLRRDGITTYRAHTIAYVWIRGIAPVGLEPDHLCRVKRCCNPWHIEWVTHKENTRRGDVGKWNRDKNFCASGHEYSVFNTYVHNGKRYCRECRKALMRFRRKR